MFILSLDCAYVADKSQALFGSRLLCLESGSVVPVEQSQAHTACMSRGVPSVEMSSILNTQST